MPEYVDSIFKTEKYKTFAGWCSIPEEDLWKAVTSEEVFYFYIEVNLYWKKAETVDEDKYMPDCIAEVWSKLNGWGALFGIKPTYDVWKVSAASTGENSVITIRCSLHHEKRKPVWGELKQKIYQEHGNPPGMDVWAEEKSFNADRTIAPGEKISYEEVLAAFEQRTVFRTAVVRRADDESVDAFPWFLGYHWNGIKAVANRKGMSAVFKQTEVDRIPVAEGLVTCVYKIEFAFKLKNR